MDEKQLKSKIKTIKDVYRHELAKTERSQKSGAGIEEVYSPKLLWFNSAHFSGTFCLLERVNQIW